MKVLLTAINAKYIHTNIAIRYLKEYAKDSVKSEICLAEYTINNYDEQIIDEIYRQKPDIICFSVYIWNIEQVKNIITEYKKIAPDTKIILGGPEVTYESEKFLKSMPQVDIIMLGEGEESFKELVYAMENNQQLDNIKGLVFRKDEEIIKTLPREEFPMEKIPFPYPDIKELKNKIFYFESQRGCPFKCSYCLSSVSRNVRFMPLDMVFRYLDIFLENGARQVKFVDRTFNTRKGYALAIWKYLKEHDNGITNFHFEITAHLLDEETLEFLKTVRKEQFQFEVGVQSTNEKTIKAINRTTNTQKLMKICQKVDSFKNIHQHLDLIAGLPYEDISSFKNSFDTVISIRPQQLQLGFLKVLKGSQMYLDAEKYGIVYKDKAPYEMLLTNFLSYDDVLLLKGTCEMTETFYNSGRFINTLNNLLEKTNSAFEFFKQLGVYYVENNLHLTSHSKEDMHTILKDFYELNYQNYDEYLKQIVLFDICLHEKPKKLPEFIDISYSNDYKDKIAEFFRDKENFKKYIPSAKDEDIKWASKSYHLQIFKYDITSNDKTPKDTAILFDYKNRDLLANASYIKVTL